MDQANLWTRRSNTKDKPTLSTRDIDNRDTSKSDSPRPFTGRRFGDSTSKTNPFGAAPPASIKSPGAGASSAFGLGTGAFASFGSAKTPKTPGGGTGFDFSSRDKDRKEKEKDVESDGAERSVDKTSTADSSLQNTPDEGEHVLKHSWKIYYRAPANKYTDYEKSIIEVGSFPTVEGFWKIYVHLKAPSFLPIVSDYHIFKEKIRPVWEDEYNKNGGKWIIRLKKGVADRYWENLLLAMIGDQFMEANEEVCGAVLSVRGGEDVLSVWTQKDGGKNVKIRETIKRVLSLPPDTNIVWRSHDESIAQRSAADEARQQKSNQPAGSEKRRTTSYMGDSKERLMS